jgi:uncharacterized protein YjbI with pentapeptide repeats
MEGARLGGNYFRALCHNILRPGEPAGSRPWDLLVVPAQNPQYGVDHFVDADPTPWPCWLEYLRTRRVPFVEAGPLRERVICDSERAGLAELAEGLGQLADWRRQELQALLVRPGGVYQGARLRGQDLSNLGFAKCSLRRADLSDCTLTDCTFDGADMVGANLQRAVMTRSSLPRADLRKACLSGARLAGADLSDANLSGAKLIGADLSGCNLAGATLPPWSSGLMEGVKLAGATGWVPADRDMRQAKLKGAELKGADLKSVNLSNADLQAASLSNADLSGADLSGANLRSADLTAAELSGARLCGAMLAGARGGRAATVQVQRAGAKALHDTLKVGSPVVVALTAARALRLRSVAVVNEHDDRSSPGYGMLCAKRMEVLTGPAASGPWTSVATFTSAKTKDWQTFAAAPDAPALFGFVQVLVHDTYDSNACVREVSLEGEAWGPAA